MRSCAWIGYSNPWIMCDSMFLTILSMSDSCGICFLIIDREVSVGINAWEVCVYVVHQQDRLLFSQLCPTFPPAWMD